VVNGSRQDYVNHYLEGREVTLELSSEFQLESEHLDTFWNINKRSFLHYMAQCMYGIRGTVSDKETGDPIAAAIHIPGHDSAYSMVSSRTTYGDFYRLIKEGIYDVVVSAPGYLNDTIHDVPVTDYQATHLKVQLNQDPTLGIPLQDLNRFRIYPNPVIQELTIDPASQNAGRLYISIVSVTGQHIISTTRNNRGETIQLSLAELPAGFYMLTIRSNTGIRTYPIVKQ
jgi:hypothetical protein